MKIYSSYSSKSNFTHPKQNFTGHGGFEKLPFLVGMRNEVTTETRMFRDFETINFATNYIKRVFRDAPQKNIVVGACSTGEEVYSMKMLMGSTPSEITGFDIGKDTIKQAKSGIIELHIPAKKYTKFIDMDTYKDSFLAIEDENINNEQKFLKEIFNKTFEKTENKSKLIYKVSEKLRKLFNISLIEFDKRLFKCKETDVNCKFIRGDIKELNKIIPQKQSVHLFSFKNAIYHIITDNNYCHRENIEPQRARIILDKIFKDINKTLYKDGLFIMGEMEHQQHSNMNFINRALLKNGFLPIRMPDKPYLNIWKKVKEID